VPGRRVRTSAPASGRVRTPGRPPRGTAPSAGTAPFKYSPNRDFSKIYRICRIKNNRMAPMTRLQSIPKITEWIVAKPVGVAGGYRRGRW
jgi:hypothetical protein